MSSRRRRSSRGNQKVMVEECAAKVVDELQRTMAFDMGKIQSLGESGRVDSAGRETIGGKFGNG